MIEDAKCAVRSLRAHASDYNLDPNRIGIEGDSVGGQIALLVGLTDQTVGWDVGQYLDVSSQVEAVVDFFGPTDLNDRSLYDLVTRKGKSAFHNLGWNSPELIKASPITYVKQDAPPIFIAHGNLDLTVRFAQSQMFYDKMKALGAPITLVEMKNGIHSFGSVLYQVSPTYDEVYAMSVDFLVNKLTSLTLTAIPTIAPTATATPAALMVEAKDISAYCRFGPSTDYSSVGFLDPGHPVPVEGTVADHSWWEIRNPSNLDTDCWVGNSVTSITGDPSGIPIVAAPNGNAIRIAVSLAPVIHGCSGSANTFEGTITTNGPSVITYHWDVYNPVGDLVDTSPTDTLVFNTAGSQAVAPRSFIGSYCGTYTINLVVTYPNWLQGQATYDVR